MKSQTNAKGLLVKKKNRKQASDRSQIKLEYSLHEGGVIEYRRYENKQLVQATVTRIGESKWKG